MELLHECQTYLDIFEDLHLVFVPQKQSHGVARRYGLACHNGHTSDSNGGQSGRGHLTGPVNRFDSGSVISTAKVLC